MKKITSMMLFFVFTNAVFSQSSNLWQKITPSTSKSIKENKINLPKEQTFELDIEALKQSLNASPNRETARNISSVIVSFPNTDGQLEKYRIFEAPVLSPELAAKYPNINSYAGQGIDDPTAVIRFSVSPKGFQSMKLAAGKPATFIESYSEDGTLYAAYTRDQKIDYSDDFQCEVTEEMNRTFDIGNSTLRNADDGILRTYRLAVSTTGEYTAYHGGTKAGALAAINATMTRVNGVFENDFNVTMVLIDNNDDVIYTNANSDPYTSSLNSQLQSTLTSVIGEANYDIGHLFARASNNGNAGCIGCVCTNGQKGSAFTSRTDPEGDPFDIDYVAHEMGHQFGGNHTWTFNGNEGTDAQMEPGSGTTIMGYAGITGSDTDVQQNSDPYFHARSIEQITNYIKTKNCQTNTNTGNAVPTVNAGANYSIPKGTAFVLDGSASDADAGDVLTYCWEQYDENNASTTIPSATATSGVAFRSFSPTTDTKRYFPRLETVKTGSTSWKWEVVPTVARTLNFRLTVRDNRAGGANNNSDDMVVNVRSGAGPFIVNSPNTNVTWNAGSTQTVTWDVAGTTGNGVNAANVDIFLSTDGGNTYPITLATSVPNDGSHNIVVPNNQGSSNRIMVKGSNNIFFDISNANFTIAGQIACNASTPSGLSASSVGSNTATLNWSEVSGATYDLRYRVQGTTSWTTTNVTGNSNALSGLNPTTTYEAQVRSTCPNGSNSSYSSSINFTTTEVQITYCDSASTNVNDEYISRVQLNTIDNSSNGQFYSDFTSISTNLTQGDAYTITVTPTWTGTVYDEGYSVWIDYNKDGDFTDAGEQVWTQAKTKNTPVSGTFTIPSGTVIGSTRMRVSMKYNAIPTSCESFTYGEVEDYTVNLIAATPDTIAPVITLNGASTINLEVGDSFADPGATATDNVDGNLTSSIVVTGSVNTNAAGTYTLNYNVSDAAGNAATQVSRTVNVTQPTDTTAPVITLNGASVIYINVGDSFTDPGATATDNVDGDLTSSIVVTGSVNTNAQGTYTLNYNVSDAAGNAATQVSRTVNVNEVSTGCQGGVTSFPYTEGYENTLGAWTQSTDDDINWTVDANGTPSNGTGPSSASQGTYYVYVEASGNGNGYPNKRAILNSPCYDLSGETFATFTFKYHMYGDNDMGTIALEASSDNGNNWTSVWSESGNKGNSWQTASVNLSNYAGGNLLLRYNRVTGSTWKADIAIDDVKLTTGGNSGGNSTVVLTLNFDNYPEETSWEIQDSSNNVVASGGTYASQADGSTLNIDVELPDGCYSLVMKDSYGDGMCCSYGNGSYSLSENGNVLASGGSFDSSETKSFCVGGATNRGEMASRDFNKEIKSIVKVYPNPVGDVLNISLIGFEAQSYQVSNMLGKVVLQGRYSDAVDVSKLPAGVYMIQLNIGEKTKVKRFVKK